MATLLAEQGKIGQEVFQDRLNERVLLVVLPVEALEEKLRQNRLDTLNCVLIAKIFCE